MTVDHVPTNEPGPGPRWRRRLWEGALPEALGLGFVAIIFGGFLAGYFIADYTWRQEAQTAQQADADSVTAAYATALGAAVEDDPRAAEVLLQNLARVPRVRSVRWVGADGTLRFEWPQTLPPAAGARPDVILPRGSAADVRTAALPVRSLTGTSAGQLIVTRATPGAASYQTALLAGWGIAGALTLLVFAIFYHRLRRHLRPLAAIERNLQTYAEGVEKELLTLALSDTLGPAACGWNRLVTQLAELQRQGAGAAGARGAPEVLARFENALFRRVVDRLPGGVLCVGKERTITYANASAAALLGRRPEELIGRAVSEAIENQAVAQAVVAVQARSGAVPSVDHSFQNGDQEFTLRFRVISMSATPGAGEALIAVEDISALRETQRTRDNFLYHVTHELRTPLTNIHAYAETLTKPGFDDEQTRKECYNVLISETERLSHLVEDILNISQLEVGSARLNAGEVDLARLIRQMVQDNLGRADEKHIDLTLTLPPKVPKLSGDKQRLSVLLSNLIGNALKYTPEGGKVSVNVEIVDQRVTIAVADTGIGIAPEDQPQVFEKFFRAASEQVQTIAGTGLGLTLAREVARLHGGDITLTSELGQGSTFTVELPLSLNDTEVPTR
jgi:PAS domain S-box-containing protein